MLVTFLLGLFAGWAADRAEPQVTSLLAGLLLPDDPPFDHAEARALSLALCLLVAAVMSWVLAVPHAVPLILGGCIGLVLPRVRDRVRAARTPDYDT